MKSAPKVGDRVRINEKHPWGPEVTDSRTKQGVEFTVTRVTGVVRGGGHEWGGFYVSGDPEGIGVWGDFLDPVGTVEEVKAEQVKPLRATLITWATGGPVKLHLSQGGRVSKVLDFEEMDQALAMKALWEESA